MDTLAAHDTGIGINGVDALHLGHLLEQKVAFPAKAPALACGLAAQRADGVGHQRGDKLAVVAVCAREAQVDDRLLFGHILHMEGALPQHL